MRRILQVFNQYREYGGEEAIIDDLSRALERSVSLHNHFFRSRDWVASGAPSRLRQAALSIYNPASAATLRRLHREFRPDFWLFHNMLPIGSPSAYRAAGVCGVPVIQYLHNYRPFSISGSYWVNGDLAGPALRPRHFHEAVHGAWNGSVAQGLVMAAAMKLLLASGWLSAVKAWVGVSPAIAEHLIEAGIPRNRTFSLPPPWPCKPISIQAETKKEGFLFLGRLIPEKGILFLLDAWNRFLGAPGKNKPRLIIAGMGPLESQVRAWVARNPLVEFRGRVAGDEKERLLRNCDALIVPSLWWDPNPTVVGEVFNHSRPVIAARIGGLAHRVLQGETGLLYEPRDANALLGAVQTLSENPLLADTLGNNAKDWLRDQSDPDRWTRQLFAIADSASR